MWNLNLHYVGFPINLELYGLIVVTIIVLAKVWEKFPGWVDLVDDTFYYWELCYCWYLLMEERAAVKSSTGQVERFKIEDIAVASSLTNGGMFARLFLLQTNG